MYFDLAAFFRYNFKAFFNSKEKHYQLTPKRFIILLIWLGLFIPYEVILRIFLILDEIFFPGYHRQDVIRPVFIIGNPRSGTTFLHQLMDKDKEHFTSLKVWELIFAPSIIQRKLIWGIKKITTLIGAPIEHIIHHFNRRMADHNKAHTIRIDAAEEDEHILIHAWSSASLWALYPIPEEVLPYFNFDRDIPGKQKDRVMRFYRNMLQRHLYAHGGNFTLLSKNPAFTPKIASLLQYFPDARFINLARNPLETMPSIMNYMAAGWKLSCDPLEAYPHKKEFFEILNYYYKYPVEFFQDRPEICAFLRYEDLVTNPQVAVREIYTFLGLEISKNYDQIVSAECEKAKQYQSSHIYSMSDMGLTTDQINSAFKEVISLYGFGTALKELPEEGFLWQIRNSGTKRRQRRLARHSKRQRGFLFRKIRMHKRIFHRSPLH
jgi:hypothetical protein